MLHRGVVLVDREYHLVEQDSRVRTQGAVPTSPKRRERHCTTSHSASVNTRLSQPHAGVWKGHGPKAGGRVCVGEGMGRSSGKAMTSRPRPTGGCGPNHGTSTTITDGSGDCKPSMSRAKAYHASPGEENSQHWNARRDVNHHKPRHPLHHARRAQQQHVKDEKRAKSTPESSLERHELPAAEAVKTVHVSRLT